MNPYIESCNALIGRGSTSGIGEIFKKGGAQLPFRFVPRTYNQAMLAGRQVGNAEQGEIPNAFTVVCQAR